MRIETAWFGFENVLGWFFTFMCICEDWLAAAEEVDKGATLGVFGVGRLPGLNFWTVRMAKSCGFYWTVLNKSTSAGAALFADVESPLTLGFTKEKQETSLPFSHWFLYCLHLTSSLARCLVMKQRFVCTCWLLLGRTGVINKCGGKRGCCGWLGVCSTSELFSSLFLLRQHPFAAKATEISAGAGCHKQVWCFPRLMALKA